MTLLSSLRQIPESFIKRSGHFIPGLSLFLDLGGVLKACITLSDVLYTTQCPFNTSELQSSIVKGNETSIVQVASELGSERVIWTTNGIAPHSIDDPGVGK